MDAGYDDIDFISDITMDELEEIGITKKGGCGIMLSGCGHNGWVCLSFFCAGHLKRFMRGIAELVEVMKSAPPTPSSIPPTLLPSVQLNGMVGGTSAEDTAATITEDTSKTPEPTNEPTPTVPDTPTPAQVPDTPTFEESPPPPPPSAAVPPVTSAPPEPSPAAQQAAGNSNENSASNFSKMRSLLAQQMGITADSADGDSSDTASPSGGSPAHSPAVSSVERRQHKAPPPPKRVVSSSSDRMSGSHDRASMEIPSVAAVDRRML